MHSQEHHFIRPNIIRIGPLDPPQQLWGGHLILPPNLVRLRGRGSRCEGVRQDEPPQKGGVCSPPIDSRGGLWLIAGKMPQKGSYYTL